MRLYTFYFLLGAVLLGFQIHPLLPFAQQGIRPDLVLILVIYLATRPEVESGAGALLVSLLGYFCAAFSSGPFGLYAFLYLFFFVCVGLLKNVFDLHSIYLQVLLVIFCSLLEGALLVLLCWGFHNTQQILLTVKNILPRQLALTVAAAPGILLLLQHVTKRLAQNNAINLFRMFSKSPAVKTVHS